MITKYKLFESSGNRSLTDEEFLELYKKNCTQHSWNNENTIYRSFNGVKENSYFNPYEHKHMFSYKQDGKTYRNGAYATYPFYTLFINHDEAWKDFPKRQLICSANIVQEFGHLSYIVIPYDNAKIGVVSHEDIHKCGFNESVEELDRFITLHKFFDIIGDNLKNKGYLGRRFSTKYMKLNYSKFTKLLKRAYENFVDDDDDDDDDFKNGAVDIEYFDIDYIRSLVNPETLNFKSLDYNDFKNDKSIKRNEIWTDSEVLFVYLEAENLERIKTLTGKL